LLAPFRTATSTSPRHWRRELGRISLAEALELTILIARKDPPRYPRVAARWLQRLLEEHPS